MNDIIDFLIKSKIPFWSVLLIVAVMWLVSKLFQSDLEKKKEKEIKELENKLMLKTIETEKLIETHQRRYEEKLVALDELDGLLNNFNHEFEFFIIGKPNPKNFDKYYYSIRKKIRNSKSIIGDEGIEIEKMINDITDTGKELISVSFIINQESISYLKNEGVPNQIVDMLGKAIGNAPSTIANLVLEIKDEATSYREEIFKAVVSTSNLTFQLYWDKLNKYKDVVDKSRQRLPTISNDSKIS